MRVHAFVLIAFALVQQPAAATESSLEQQFVQRREGFTCVEGPTNEQSCSGTGMTVYLRGDSVQHLDWTIEMSTKYIRQQYYFRGSAPVLVVETIQAKFDAQANRLEEPRLLSVTRYRLDDAGHGKRRKELLEHADFLLRDFHEHRAEFSPCGHPNT
jgi:hypothetical protein